MGGDNQLRRINNGKWYQPIFLGFLTTKRPLTPPEGLLYPRSGSGQFTGSVPNLCPLRNDSASSCFSDKGTMALRSQDLTASVAPGCCVWPIGWRRGAGRGHISRSNPDPIEFRKMCLELWEQHPSQRFLSGALGSICVFGERLESQGSKERAASRDCVFGGFQEGHKWPPGGISSRTSRRPLSPNSRLTFREGVLSMTHKLLASAGEDPSEASVFRSELPIN